MEGSGVLGKEVCHRYVHPPLPVLLIFFGIKLVLSQKLQLYIDLCLFFDNQSDKNTLTWCLEALHWSWTLVFCPCGRI